MLADAALVVVYLMQRADCRLTFDFVFQFSD